MCIIPTHNECQGLAAVGSFLLRHHPRLTLMVVDDASTDGTREIIDTLAKLYRGRVIALLRDRRFGLGQAYRDGFRRALAEGFEWVIQMDADGSHSPESLLLFLECMQANENRNVQWIVGSRWLPGSHVPGLSIHRRWLSTFAGRLLRMRFDETCSDMTGGFNAWHRDLLQAMDWDRFCCRGFGFQIELKLAALARQAAYVEVPITFLPRKAGTSKLRLKDIAEATKLLLLDRHHHKARESPDE